MNQENNETKTNNHKKRLWLVLIFGILSVLSLKLFSLWNTAQVHVSDFHSSLYNFANNGFLGFLFFITFLIFGYLCLFLILDIFGKVKNNGLKRIIIYIIIIIGLFFWYSYDQRPCTIGGTGSVEGCNTFFLKLQIFGLTLLALTYDLLRLIKK